MNSKSDTQPKKNTVNKLQIKNRLTANIDLTTGTGTKGYVMYGIAQITLGVELSNKVLVLGPPSTTIEKAVMKSSMTSLQMQH